MRELAYGGMSLLDRLMGADAAIGAPEVMALRDAIARDLQNLLNARSPWRPLDARWPVLRPTIRCYGLPDFTGGAFDAQEQRQELRDSILAAITRFEPRLTHVQVSLRSASGGGGPTLLLVIEALMVHAGQHLGVAFQTLLEASTADMRLSPADD